MTLNLILTSFVLMLLVFITLPKMVVFLLGLLLGAILMRKLKWT